MDYGSLYVCSVHMIFHYCQGSKNPSDCLLVQNHEMEDVCIVSGKVSNLVYESEYQFQQRKLQEDMSPCFDPKAMNPVYTTGITATVDGRALYLDEIFLETGNIPNDKFIYEVLARDVSEHNFEIIDRALLFLLQDLDIPKSLRYEYYQNISAAFKKGNVRARKGEIQGSLFRAVYSLSDKEFPSLMKKSTRGIRNMDGIRKHLVHPLRDIMKRVQINRKRGVAADAQWGTSKRRKLILKAFKFN